MFFVRMPSGDDLKKTIIRDNEPDPYTECLIKFAGIGKQGRTHRLYVKSATLKVYKGEKKCLRDGEK